MNDAAPAPPETTVAAAALLSLVGGYLDAFTYVGHGGVFANAQTGNVVLLGMAVADGDWAQALRHVPSVLAFLLGVFAVRTLQLAAARRDWRAERPALAVEAAILLAIGALPAATPDLWIVVAVAFAASLQFAGLTTVGGWTYASVVTTGNLRRLAESVFAAAVARDDASAPARIRAFALICAAFAVGAGLGTLATRRLHNLAALPPAGVLLGILAVALSATRRRRPA